MLSRITTSLILLATPIMALCQTKTNIQVKPQGNAQPIQIQAAPAPAPKPLNFKRMASGLEYCFIVDKPTSPKPTVGDMVKLHMRSMVAGRGMYDSYTTNKGKPVEFSVNQPAFKGDIIEAIMLMTPGDSIVVQVDADDIFKGTKNKKPDFVKKGDKVIYTIKLASVKTKEQVQKEQQAQVQKQIKEQTAKLEAQRKKQVAIDEKALQKYFVKNVISPYKTASGLYYKTTQVGTGPMAKKNDKVKMNYRGTLLDGTIFDSNIDSAFGHMSPFEFKLGVGQVINGWDEGIALLNKGAKATLYIPSYLAYGSNARPGGGANPKGIPANSPLVFEVEVLDIVEPINEDVALQELFKKQNLSPIKTASGLYYMITNPGTGEKAKPGQMVSMNYTGALLDGTKFDSNTDSAFNHVQPFTFELGKGAVIKGWDEGVALLSKGAKATFFIPSNLAYGERSMPGSGANPKGIPSGSTLIFDVELLDIIKK